ncbi:MFS family permease [Arthrobacter sp. UYCo732]
MRDERRGRRRFFVRWLVAVTLAETVGFSVPAIAGGLLTAGAFPAQFVYPAMIAAGTAEGALLGAGQGIGFGAIRPFRTRTWILATALGAGLAWAIGMLPSTLGLFELSPLAVGLLFVGGLVLLASIPTLQWLVLRRTVRNAWRWIPWNMVAWAAGILWTLAPSPLVDERTPIEVITGVYMAAGLLMAVTVAAVTSVPARHVIRKSMHNSEATAN